MREKFEEWAKDYVKARHEPKPGQLSDDLPYTSPYTQAAWEGWQAAWAWGALQASEETELFRTALTKVAALVDSEADDPLDDAINIASEALHCNLQR